MHNPNATASGGDRHAWLFPLTYAVHFCEEYAAGEGFPEWFSRAFGAHLSRHDFVALNAVAWTVMTLGALEASRRRALAAVYLPALGTLVSVNALAHLVGSLVTGRYSPGAVSGALLWLPLGVVTLRREARVQSRGRLAAAMFLGLLLHGLVTLLALSS